MGGKPNLRPAALAAVALVVGLMIAGVPAAYFYQQTASQQSTASLYKSQAAEDNATIVSLLQNITALQAQAATLKAELANASTQAQADQSKIASLQSMLAFDATEIQQLNQELVSSDAIIGFQMHSTLWRATIDERNETQGVCGGVYLGPFSVYWGGGYLAVTVNGTGSLPETQVSWAAYGVNYTSPWLAGNASFPVLPTSNLNVTTYLCAGAVYTVGIVAWT